SLVALRAIEQMGIDINRKIKDAVIHKWNIIAYLGGLDERMLARDYQEALLLEKQIVRRLFRPSEEGKQLTQALVAFIHEIEQPIAADYGAHMIRHLLGNQIGDLLGLPELSLLNWPGLISPLNGLVAKMGWSPKEQDMPVPLHLALLKRGEVQNERIHYPLQEILEKKPKA
ncbi:MAG: oxygenase MpaB family protein, partial [Bacteroidota bacterium]|nr:oxygenase MpaB family protein [Bacteroidota bacterium]MDX5430160.1 oxygenase MpaB family protein [Bacteroidota bacterium]MDX5468922.1 oxygenase MpaB family protein [Bacteroidota bacterium]